MSCFIHLPSDIIYVPFTFEEIEIQYGYRQLIGRNDTNFFHLFLMQLAPLVKHILVSSTLLCPIFLAKTIAFKAATTWSVILAFEDCKVANMPIFLLCIFTTASQFIFTNSS
jgi:hypothetical protein